MNQLELRLARETLGLSQAEAAEFIGNVTQRSWSYWENHLSGREVPADVVKKVEDFLGLRSEKIKEILRATTYRKEVIIFYHDKKDCADSILNLRLQQSIVRSLATDFRIETISFNRDNYDTWLNGRQDDLELRREWAHYYFVEINQ